MKKTLLLIKRYSLAGFLFLGGVFWFQEMIHANFLVPPSLQEMVSIWVSTWQVEKVSVPISVWVEEKSFSQRIDTSEDAFQGNSGSISDISIRNGVFRGIVNLAGKKISDEYFVTLSNGDVQKKKAVFFEWRNDSVLVIFPVFRRGEYKIEILDSYGFPFFQYSFTLGKFGERSFPKKEEFMVTGEDIIRDINTLRMSLGRGVLSSDIILQKIAMEKSRNMAENNYIWHFTPEGYDVLDMAENMGISDLRVLGENVAWGNVNLATLQQWLLASWGHRYNMLSGNWRKVGIGFSYSWGVLYLSQVFGE